MDFLTVLFIFFVGLFDHDAMKTKIDLQASYPEALKHCEGVSDCLVWDDRTALLHLSFSPQWKNALEFTH
eukprot:563802-Amphidinium_carterae.1